MKSTVSRGWFNKKDKRKMSFAFSGLGTNWLVFQKYLLIVVPSGIQVFDWTLQKFLTHVSLPDVTCINSTLDAEYIAVLGTSSGQVFLLDSTLQVKLFKKLNFGIHAIAPLKKCEYVVLTVEKDDMSKVYLASNGKCMLQGRGRGVLDVSPEGIILFSTNFKVQRWEYPVDPKAQRIQTLTHTETIHQCRSSVNGNLLLSDQSGKIIQFKVQEGKIGEKERVVRHWHSLPGVDFAVLEGSGLVSGGQESVLVKWNVSAGDEKGGKQFLPRLGGPVTKLQISKHSERAFAFLSTTDQELVVVDLVSMKVFNRMQLWGGLQSPFVLMHPKAPNVLLSDLLGGVQFFNICEQKSYNVHYPEALDRVTPNEAKDVVKYPQVYTASYSRQGNLLATVEKSIGETHIMRIYQEKKFNELTEECTVYQPHNESAITCAWTEDACLVTHSSALKELKVWKRGKTVLQEEMGKWRVTKLHSNVSLFAANANHLVMLKDGLLIVDDQTVELPSVSILGMWMHTDTLDDTLVLQANDNQVLVVCLKKKSVIGGFSNISIVSISRNCVLYDYFDRSKNELERFIAKDVHWEDQKIAWDRQPASQVTDILHGSDGTLLKRSSNSLQVDLDAPSIASLDIQRSVVIKEEEEDQVVEQIKKRQRKAMDLRKALLPLVPSYELPIVPEIFELLFN